MLRDGLALLLRPNGRALVKAVLDSAPEQRITRFLNTSRDLIARATEAKLPRLVIPTCLSYARIAQLEGWYRRAIASAAADAESSSNTDEQTPLETARALLTTAHDLCNTFPGGANYVTEVEDTMRLFESERYEEVTPEEIAAIKKAMVSGPEGISTHSGHWYTCRNGHPVSLQMKDGGGDCGGRGADNLIVCD